MTKPKNQTEVWLAYQQLRHDAEEMLKKAKSPTHRRIAQAIIDKCRQGEAELKKHMPPTG